MTIVNFRNALPGFATPSVGFEAPFEMLEACHERVQRMLTLLQRLQAHAAQNGCDTQARQAAVDVMRYFDLAAPLHHQDEDMHVFPLLAQADDAALQALAQALQDQHRVMEAQWQSLRGVLQAMAQWQAGQATPDLCHTTVAAFADIYQRHIALEEQTAYPAARRLHTAQSLVRASEEMMRRRGLTT